MFTTEALVVSYIHNCKYLLLLYSIEGPILEPWSSLYSYYGYFVDV